MQIEIGDGEIYNCDTCIREHFEISVFAISRVDYIN